MGQSGLFGAPMRAEFSYISLDRLPGKDDLDTAPPSADFVATVREQGVLEPILAERRVDGSLRIVAGRNRLFAAIEAGLSDIGVMIWPVGEINPDVVALIENGHRRDNSLTTLLSVESLMATGADTRTIARKTRLATATIERKVRLIKTLLPELRHALIEQRLSMAVAERASSCAAPVQRRIVTHLEDTGCVSVSDIAILRKDVEAQTVQHALFDVEDTTTGQDTPWHNLLVKAVMMAFPDHGDTQEDLVCLLEQAIDDARRI